MVHVGLLLWFSLLLFVVVAVVVAFSCKGRHMDKSCCGAQPACFFTTEAYRASLELSIGPQLYICGKEDSPALEAYFCKKLFL